MVKVENIMTHLKCATHGRQKETFVCKHIIETMTDGEARGFCWGVNDKVHEAICDQCNNLSEADFSKQASDLIRPLCFGCFRQAAEFNGIILE